jgi:membrane protein
MLDYISKENLKVKVKAVYQWADNLSRGILGILVRASQTFARADAAEAAASIAYYALFSLFPLLLFLVTIGSSVLEIKQVEQQVLDFTATTLPTAQDLVKKNITQVLAQRGTVGIVSIIGLLWAATSVFTILARNINKAWHSARPRNFLQRRLMGMMIVGILTSLLLLSLFSTTLFKLLPWLDAQTSLWRESIPLYETLIWKIASRLVPWFFTFVMFFGLYHWIPNTKVRWSEAAWGALVAAIAGEITKSGFTWYLASGLVKYHLVYGSLGTLVVLMLSIYLSSLIILFGAHLSAAIAHHRQAGTFSPADK